MTEITISTIDFESLRHRLLESDREECAVLFASPITRTNGSRRYVVRDVRFPESDEFVAQTPIEAELSASFVARMSKIAARSGSTLVFVHSHVSNHPPRFSDIDDLGEERLRDFLRIRCPATAHFSMVVSKGGLQVRELGTSNYITLVVLGNQRIVYSPSIEDNYKPSIEFDRQIRAFGDVAQKELGAIRVAIVGLGGTGSVVAQLTCHLGVEDFLLIDPDVVELTNLNRVANASHLDVGLKKVDMAKKYICRFSNAAVVECVYGDVTEAAIAEKLASVDLIFGCTDSHGSRAVIQQMAYQFLVPCIDMGTIISVGLDKKISHIYGRVQLLSPGLACLTCANLLDPKQVRQDLMTPYERSLDPYIVGDQAPAPAVMSLNATVSSLAVSMLLAVVAGAPIPARNILYNAIASTIRQVKFEPDDGCHVCSIRGALGRAYSWPLPGRSN